MNILFIGAHPDDIELASWSLVTRAVNSGYNVYFLILSDEPDAAIKSLRRGEALASVRRFGVPDDRLFFLGQSDGFVSCDKNSVTSCRTTFADIHFDAIAVHTDHDGHQDHRTANQIARSAFRRCVVLTYAVFISGESDFAPRYASEMTTQEQASKKDHLCAFESQSHRIDFERMADWESFMSSQPEGRAEGFNIMLQSGSSQETAQRLIADLDLRARS